MVVIKHWLTLIGEEQLESYAGVLATCWVIVVLTMFVLVITGRIKGKDKDPKYVSTSVLYRLLRGD